MASAKRDRPLFKVIVLGDSGVGKTSLLRRYTSDVFKEERLQRPSIGADVLSKFDAEAGAALQLWDTPGQDRYACIATAFVRGCHALLLLFDVKSLASFRNLDRWYDLFASQMPLDPGQRIPVVIVGNKADSDWRAGSSSMSMISDDMVRDWCADKGNIPYFYTSAKDAINVDQPFRQIVQDCLALHRANSDSISITGMLGPSYVVLRQTEDTSCNCCCAK